MITYRLPILGSPTCCCLYIIVYGVLSIIDILARCITSRDGLICIIGIGDRITRPFCNSKILIEYFSSDKRTTRATIRQFDRIVYSVIIIVKIYVIFNSITVGVHQIGSPSGVHYFLEIIWRIVRIGITNSNILRTNSNSSVGAAIPTYIQLAACTNYDFGTRRK